MATINHIESTFRVWHQFASSLIFNFISLGDVVIFQLRVPRRQISVSHPQSFQIMKKIRDQRKNILPQRWIVNNLSLCTSLARGTKWTSFPDNLLYFLWSLFFGSRIFSSPSLTCFISSWHDMIWCDKISNKILIRGVHGECSATVNNE